MAKRLKWGTIEHLNTLIDEYFEKTKTPTLAGLCLHLNISKDTWNYYVSDKWRTHRMEGEELEEKKKEAEQSHIDGILEDDMEVSASRCLSEEFNQADRRENEHIKSLVSEAFKKAKLRYESFIEESIQINKNPAGPIFLAKATLGYRETAPEQTEQNKLPASINIVVMPPPEKPKALDIIEIRPLPE